jgi:predicted nuclease of restriction endonuclease-like (RecB) superfamily
VQTLSAQLTAEYGKGFSRTNLFSMVRLAEAFPDQRIVQTLSVQLGWSHFYQIIYFDDDLNRDFYAEMCRLERWSVRTLRDKIRDQMYERTAIAKKPEKVIRADLDALRDTDRLTPDLVFRDPYVLDFLRLPADFQEADLEQAILRELETFLLELGGDFAFVARQKRMTVDGTDYYLDLLFYHRRLRRLVGVELKLGAFTAADKGQMELYLRWLKRYEWRDGEEEPIALILCAGKCRRARRAARTRSQRHSRGRVPDRLAAEGGPAAEAARRHPDCQAAARERAPVRIKNGFVPRTSPTQPRPFLSNNTTAPERGSLQTGDHRETDVSVRIRPSPPSTGEVLAAGTRAGVALNHEVRFLDGRVTSWHWLLIRHVSFTSAWTAARSTCPPTGSGCPRRRRTSR